MRHIMTCRCDHKEEVAPDLFAMGAVWRCPECGEGIACVRARDGRREWVVLDAGYADFKRLWDEPVEETEDAA